MQNDEKWNIFASTGKVEDYLKYKLSEAGRSENINADNNRGNCAKRTNSGGYRQVY